MTASSSTATPGGGGSGGTGSGGTKSKSTKASAAKAIGAGTQTKQKKKRKPIVQKNTITAPSQATLAAAQRAKNDLAQQQRQAAARITDPLWYRIEDILPPQYHQPQQQQPQQQHILPEQIQIVEAALSHNHLTRSDVTPQAMACLLEQARRYAHELLTDAQDYAGFSNRSEPSKADLQLAAEMRADHPISVHAQLPKLNLLAREVNKIPLPPIPSNCYSGILLPPREHQLTARTYDVVIGAKVSQKMVPPPVIPSTTSSSSSKPSQKPGYGATRGTQIPILLKKDKEDPATAKQDSSVGPDATPSGGVMSTPMVPSFNP